MKWHIGCSGFHYKDWRGVFYPVGLPQKKWFEYYSSRFDTLELNVTFYRFPQVKYLQNWHEISPPNFIFTAKAPRLITHYKRFRDCEALLSDFYGTLISGLDRKLGAVLFQLPPSLQYDPGFLELMTNNLSDAVTNVVEFRHESWWSEEVFKKLKEKKIVFSGISHPRLPDETVVNYKIAYYRFHGVPELYYSVYSDKKLKAVADQFLQEEKLKEVYVYFNNTAAPGAIKNATWLKEYIEKVSVQKTTA